jgi:hypothetical protein
MPFGLRTVRPALGSIVVFAKLKDGGDSGERHFWCEPRCIADFWNALLISGIEIVGGASRSNVSIPGEQQ